MLALARRAIATARGNPGWALAILGLAVHLWARRGYDYFRGEMYFIVCGERLDWGFVDQPPLIPAVAATMHHLFPGSLVMLRLLPALAHAATIVLATATARQLGGGVRAQAIAALCVLTGGVFLGIGTTGTSLCGAAATRTRPSAPVILGAGRPRSRRKSHRTRCWREPDSNHRSRRRAISSGHGIGCRRAAAASPSAPWPRSLVAVANT
jgi:hypothetical protein